MKEMNKMNRKIKYVIVLCVIVLITLEFIVFPSLSAQIKSGRIIYPQLIENQKTDLFNNFNMLRVEDKLYVGDAGISDGIKMTVVDVKLINPNEIVWHSIFVESVHKSIDSNAKLLLVNINVENVGKTHTDTNTLTRELYPFMSYDPADEISVYYAGQRMKDVVFCIDLEDTSNKRFFGYRIYRGYGSQYPGKVIEGVVGFEVPKNINLNETILKMHGLEWRLG